MSHELVAYHRGRCTCAEDMVDREQAVISIHCHRYTFSDTLDLLENSQVEPFNLWSGSSTRELICVSHTWQHAMTGMLASLGKHWALLGPRRHTRW